MEKLLRIPAMKHDLQVFSFGATITQNGWLQGWQFGAGYEAGFSPLGVTCA
jgi:hypothetical protein